MKVELAITGLGCMTPIGHSPQVAMHSVRSGISRLSIQRYADRINEWLTGGTVLTWIPLVRQPRLKELAARTLRDAWHMSRIDNIPAWALIMGAAESMRPGYRFPNSSAELTAWSGSLGLPKPLITELVQAGSGSTHVALLRAAQLLSTGDIHACVIGAVDTQWQIEVIRWHENHARLKCGYFTDGLMPGEASCFLVIESMKHAIARQATILARIIALAHSQETATILSDKPNTATGLTNAARTALQAAGVSPKTLDGVWCDLNGESYRAREWAFTEIRLGIETHTELIHPADCHGDLGAATDANLLALAAMAQATGWAHGKPQLVFAGSEGGIRVASVIAPPPAPPSDKLCLPVSEAEPRVMTAAPVLPPLGPDEVDPAQSDDPPRTYFDWQLRQEHLEELAVLYYQRETILHDPEVEWPRVAETEQRMLNHVDAVLVGGLTSIWAVASGLLAEEEGPCFAGAFVIAVVLNPQNLERIEQALAKPSAERIYALEQALRHVRPPGLLDRLRAWLSHKNVAVQAMAIRLLGELRLGDPALVYPFLESDQPLLVRRALQTLRRRRDVYSVTEMERLLHHGDSDVAFEAALAAACLGSRSIADTCRQWCRSEKPPYPRAAMLLALFGHYWDVDLLLRTARSSALPPSEVLTALGILGYPEAVDLLLATLRSNDETLMLAAAEALDVITGAGLREEAVVPDPDNPAVHDEVIRVCTSWQQWSQWWTSHRHSFTAGNRWRMGKPFTVLRCVDEMSQPNTPLTRRQRAYWELLVHTRHDIPYEPDWFIPRQQRAINRWRTSLGDE